MSLRTWKKAFYPISAAEQVALSTEPLALVEHALRKWRGMTHESLAAHHLVRWGNRDIVDCRRGRLEINNTSCALCLVYDNGSTSRGCRGCPLYDALGCMRCDYSAMPYRRWLDDDDPLSMIRWLEAARASLIAGST